jgi:endonuclease/exonuclease/phosphatase family metal-dependent hydrolase
MVQRWILVGLAFLGSMSLWSQNTARVMFYNLLEFPEAPPSSRDLILKDIIDEVEPDIFMVAELQDLNGANIILDNALNDNINIYQSAPFVLNTSGSGGNIHQLLYYNTEKFSLELNDIIQTSLRDINRYQLKAKTSLSDTDPIIIEFFVAHFKASQGNSNEQIRFNMALDFTNYINANLSADANVIFAGDFNFYSANESGFLQLFIGNTTIPMNDPVNQLGDWHTNSDFSNVHSQSTRESNNSFNDFGAGGGLDDRFDFMFVSGNLLDNTNNVSYINNSYQTLGNNSNCYNEDISDTSCGGFYNQNLRNLLWNMSDHLPLVMDLSFQQDFLSTADFSNNASITLPSGNLVSEELEIYIPEKILYQVNELRIYNSFGQQVENIRVKTSRVELSTGQLSNGMYFIKANNGQILKFVKSN